MNAYPPGAVILYLGRVKPDTKGKVAELMERARQRFDAGDYKSAARLFARAFLLGKQTPGVLNNLALALRNNGSLEMAEAAFHMALRREPLNGSIWSNLGNLLRDEHRFAESEEAHSKAIGLKPRDPQLHYHFGLLRMEQAQPADALRHFEGALGLKPDFWQAEWDRSLALLQLGRWKEAWPGYMHRWKLEGQGAPPADGTLWDGKPFRGTLVVHHEQGFGDTLMVARFLAWAKSQCDRVIFMAPPQLAPIVSTAAGVDAVIHSESSIPSGDDVRHVPAMDLMRLSGATPQNISGKPYLKTPAHYHTKHRELLPVKRSFFRVGIVWSGSTSFSYNHRRSIRMEQLLRLMKVDGVKLFSLQKGEPAKKLAQPGMGVLVKDLREELDDFADTAAVIGHLDLVITTDTAVAHLCGAIGAQVWLLLAHRADWRWLQFKNQVAWYNSMRIFRQSRPGDWDSVLEEVIAELKAASSVGRKL